jgi:hypothetical protein
MAKKLGKKKTRKLINELVRLIQLEDLAEFEEAETGLAQYHNGCARGLRVALRMISRKDEPEYEIIDVGSKIQIQRPIAQRERVLDWVD